jgi:hypothetical protein
MDLDHRKGEAGILQGILIRNQNFMSAKIFAVPDCGPLKLFACGMELCDMVGK